jgi:DNA-directed DNA polymerase III PolC
MFLDLLNTESAGLHLLIDDPDMAAQLSETYARRLWMEVVRPAASARQEKDRLVQASRLGLPLIASTAVHFAMPEEYPVFQLATAARQGILLDQLLEDPSVKITPQHHLPDQDSLNERFRDLPEAVRNTDVLANQLSDDVLPRETVLPPPRVPRPLDANRYLKLLCERGLRERGMSHSPEARTRLRQEMALVESMDLAGYFLIVRDIARHARMQNYDMALRGSAGNCLICYLLSITDVDPLRFDLPMERFLHPGRKDLPDIDLDFDWKVRDHVIDYVFRRHGAAHTAMVSSHLGLQPRSAFREAAKIHGLSNEQISHLVEMMTSRVSGMIESEELPADAGRPPRHFPLEPERWPRILADARLLAGRPRHLSIHPGGVVITPGPIEDYVPLERAAKGTIITQFEKDAAEATGLVKIDLLGNRALSTRGEALRGVRNVPLLPPDGDSDTVRLLQAGDTLGVNQLESPAMRHLLRQIIPTGIHDVVQALALVRPGAASQNAKQIFIRRRRGLEPVRYLHPCLESVLRETLGVLVYEDDGLRVIQAMTGLSPPDAEIFRKRIVKHQTEEEASALESEFMAYCINRQIPEPVAKAQWKDLAKFIYYTFCKSHAVSYGLIGWAAAYLKVHHPVPFWSAALNNNQGVYPRRVYVEALKRAGIELRLPCVNRSDGPFTVEGNAIRVGLEAIASLDEKVRLSLLENRARLGPYRDLEDLQNRLSLGPEAVSLLIRSGALDFTSKSRPALFLEAELQNRLRRSSANSLFEDDGEVGWSPGDYTPLRRLQDEWELFNFIVGPPLMTLFRSRLPRGLIESRRLAQHIGQTVRVTGVVAASRHSPMVDGREMQFITLEDEWGLIEVTLFPGTCSPVPYLSLGPYLATGTVEEQHGVVSVTARSFRRALDED